MIAKEVDMSIKVSVLVPCFNAAEFLQEALLSILRQGYQNLVVILLDDGSTDNSLEIARHLAQSDSRLEIHTNNQNLGIIASRNKLLMLCKTEYAAWMDADDIAHPQRIEKQLAFLLGHPDYIACTCHYIRQGMGEEKVITIPSQTISKEYLLFYNYVLNPGSFFNVVKCKQNNVQFRDWLSGASDYLFWVELAQIAKIGVIPDVLMTYRLHAAQETVAQKKRQLSGVLEIVQYQLAQLDCHAETQDLARLLIYPADILKLEYTLFYLKNSSLIIQTLTKKLAKSAFEPGCVENLLFNLYRRQAWRIGVIGFIQFVKLYRMAGIKRCKNWGLNLLLFALRQDCYCLLRKLTIKGKEQ